MYWIGKWHPDKVNEWCWQVILGKQHLEKSLNTAESYLLTIDIRHREDFLKDIHLSKLQCWLENQVETAYCWL